MNRLDNLISGVSIVIPTVLVAFFDSTSNYLIALIIGFAFNILAGFKADDVKIKLHRLFPPVFK